MDLEKVRELVKLVEDSKIDELEITGKDATIRIQKNSGVVMSAAAMAPQMVQAPAAAAPAAEVKAESPIADPTRAKWRDLRSPIVGTFYSSPSPDAPPFVQVGDKVTAGQTLCIVEAMKVMNEIEAEFSGVIKEILVENATPIEAEAVLYLIDPS
jgi:acetyl-CoA carboxylase biotin carboxyl carrier protein